MLSGAIGLQIIARRLGVELGEQQFSKFTDIDTRELTFKEIKKLTKKKGWKAPPARSAGGAQGSSLFS